MLWHPKTLQNLAMYNVFSFLAVFPLPESYQNDPKFHFNTLLRSDTQKSSKNVENTTVFWSRCETVFGPPPPAKADIATAILTNVIEHLVLLLPPNKHAFTAKAVWADFLLDSLVFGDLQQLGPSIWTQIRGIWGILGKEPVVL